MSPNIFLFALIVGLHLEPAWALLIIVIAVVIKILPVALALELIGPTIINAINRHRRNNNGQH